MRHKQRPRPGARIDTGQSSSRNVVALGGRLDVGCDLDAARVAGRHCRRAVANTDVLAILLGERAASPALHYALDAKRALIDGDALN
jgi:hypothetical protein